MATGITILTNIAALRSSSSGVTLVYVEGYSSFADGGEGLFALGASGTDNGGTIIVSANGTYYRQTNDGPLNVRWFGATGNGTTDDTSAVQTCLNVAASGGRSAVYVPRGYYILSSALTYSFASGGATSLALHGDGPDVSNLVWGSGQGTAITYYDLSNSVTVRGLGFLTGTQGGATIGLLLQFKGSDADSGNSAMNLIENCTFRGADGYAQNDLWGTNVSLNSVPLVNLISCNFVAPNGKGNYGVYIVGSSSTIVVMFNFTNCCFQGGNYSIGYGTYVQGVCVTGCNIFGSNYCVFSQGSEADLVQLTITASMLAPRVASIGLLTYIGNINLTGNLIYGVANQPAINLYSVNVVSVVANQFVGVSSGDSGVAIVATSGPVGGIITGNVFYNCGGDGVYLGSGTKNINVQSNCYQGCGTNVANAAGAANTIGGGSP